MAKVTTEAYDDGIYPATRIRIDDRIAATVWHDVPGWEARVAAIVALEEGGTAPGDDAKELERMAWEATLLLGTNAYGDDNNVLSDESSIKFGFNLAKTFLAERNRRRESRAGKDVTP